MGSDKTRIWASARYRRSLLKSPALPRRMAGGSSAHANSLAIPRLVIQSFIIGPSVLSVRLLTIMQPSTVYTLEIGRAP
jgi:hypothetical protein